MSLSLSVISFHRFTSDIEAQMQFCEDAEDKVITIGRGAQCSWCLPDPERVISNRHARIEFNNGEFLLFDTSTNGVFVNRGVEPLAKETPHTLQDGDILAIGDYEIEVNIPAKAPEATPSVTPVASADVTHPSFHSSVQDDVEFGIAADAVPEPSLPPQPEVSPPPPQNLHSGISSNMNDHISAPSPSLDDQIPEDWLGMLSPASKSEVKTEPAVVTPPPAQVSPPPVEPASVTVKPAEQPGQPAAKTQPKTAAPAKSDAAPKVRPPVDFGSSDPQALLSAFLEGMGISPELVSTENPAQWWHQLGVINRDLLDGIMNTLHNRAAFKESSRIHQTTFRRNENNPLKFSTGAEDALHNLLQRKAAGFLPPERAVKEAFVDLERHEAALVAGVEGSVAALMRLFNPETIESKGDSGGGLKKLYPAMENSRNWKQFCALYSELSSELKGDNNAFYMEDFAKAYEARLKQMEYKG